MCINRIHVCNFGLNWKKYTTFSFVWPHPRFDVKLSISVFSSDECNLYLSPFIYLKHKNLGGNRSRAEKSWHL